MTFRIAAALAVLLLAAGVADARPRHHTTAQLSAQEFCGERYCPTDAPAAARRAGADAMAGIDPAMGSPRSSQARQRASYGETGVTYLRHPPGCPARAFCACGAAVEIFGRAIRSLWPVRAWRAFPRDVPAPKNVAILTRGSHLFVLERHISGSDWLVRDYNSGGHRSRLHVRSIAGAIIVNPRAGRTAALLR